MSSILHLCWFQSLEEAQASKPNFHLQDLYSYVLSMAIHILWWVPDSLSPQFFCCTFRNSWYVYKLGEARFYCGNRSITHIPYPEHHQPLWNKGLISHLGFMFNIGWQGVCSTYSARKEAGKGSTVFCQKYLETKPPWWPQQSRSEMGKLDMGFPLPQPRSKMSFLTCLCQTYSDFLSSM